MARATNLKSKWEEHFRVRASSRYLDTKLCLTTSGNCTSCTGQDGILRVAEWSIIREDSLGGQSVSLLGDNSGAGGKLRQVCDFLGEKWNERGEAPCRWK